MSTKICELCGNKFTSHKYNKRFCTDKCRAKFNNYARYENNYSLESKICECGQQYKTRSGITKCKRCRHLKPKKIKTCGVCSNEFTPKENATKYCSEQCLKTMQKIKESTKIRKPKIKKVVTSKPIKVKPVKQPKEVKKEVKEETKKCTKTPEQLQEMIKEFLRKRDQNASSAIRK